MHEIGIKFDNLIQYRTVFDGESAQIQKSYLDLNCRIPQKWASKRQ